MLYCLEFGPKKHFSSIYISPLFHTLWFLFLISSFIAPLYIFAIRIYWAIWIFSKSLACGHYLPLTPYYTKNDILLLISNSVCCRTRMLMLFIVIRVNTRKQICVMYADRLQLSFWASTVHFCKGKVNTLMDINIKSLWSRPGLK